MDFKEHGLPHYISSLQKLCQVAQAYHGFGIEYLIADLQDLDVLYIIWYEKYIKDLELDKTIPHIYAIDRMENTYKLEEFKTAASLFYYSCRLNDTGFFHKQLRIVSDNSSSSLVKSCVANNLKPLIQQSKQDIFLTIYWGTYKESFEILNILEEVALGTSNLDIKLYKMDAKLNLVPLEYNHSIYPVHFFIPHNNGDEETERFTTPHSNKEEILEFIYRNIETR